MVPSKPRTEAELTHTARSFAILPDQMPPCLNLPTTNKDPPFRHPCVGLQMLALHAALPPRNHPLWMRVVIGELEERCRRWYIWNHPIELSTRQLHLSGGRKREDMRVGRLSQVERGSWTKRGQWRLHYSRVKRLGFGVDLGDSKRPASHNQFSMKTVYQENYFRALTIFRR